MEYQVSARKYRPMTFDAVVGQEALTITLKNAIQNGKLAHAFLFCGPRGVGKTTCARIFAKTINCEHPTAEGEACGQCESCRAFLEQRSYNIFELDAASNNSVENIKQLMEQTRIPPQIGRYKVFIIDEVHMLSTQAFNAFLKTLEEPPSYVIFILATTEKNKLLPTILSRCQIYDFDRMTVADTVRHLKMVADREGYTYDDEALELIAEKADGGMRDALSIFDQAASFCQGNITVEKVTKDLNLLDIENYFNIINFSLQNNVSEIMLLVNRMLSDGIDGQNIIVGLASHVRNVMMARDPQTISLLQVSERYSKRYAAQAKQCPVSFLYKALNILTRCDLNYRQSTNKRLLVELTLIQVAQITQPDDADAGPRGGYTLKTLFSLISSRQSNPVVQVAGSVSNATNESSRVEPSEATTSPKDAVQPNLSAKTSTNVRDESVENISKTNERYVANTKASGNASRIISMLNHDNRGTTFNSLSGHSGEEIVTVENIDVQAEEKIFSDEDVRMKWISMCNRMMQRREYFGLATSLRNLTPHITTFPQIEICVTNTILLEQIKAIQQRIKITLAQELNNSQIDVSVRLSENVSVQRQLTKGEMFEDMKNKSAALRNMIEVLHLELV